MIEAYDVYRVISAMCPLYMVVLLAYASEKWWRIFSGEQIAGINRFVALFAVPFLAFQTIAGIDIYNINYRFIAADSLPKVFTILVLFAWAILLKPERFSYEWAFEWGITIHLIFSFNNSLIIGVPVLGSMYGTTAEVLMPELVASQMIIWFTSSIILLEYWRTRKELIERSHQGKLSSVVSENVSCSNNHSIAASEAASPASVTKASELESLEFSEEDKNEDEKVIIPSSHNPGGDNIEKVAVDVKLIISSLPEEIGRRENGVTNEYRLEKAVFSRLVHNPNLHAALYGAIYSLVANGVGFKMPLLLKNNVQIVANAGLGMAMFSLGLFMSTQKKLLECGVWNLIWVVMIRVVFCPIITTAFSFALSLKSEILYISILQSALPQAIIAFVLSNEYKVHPEILSASVVITTLLCFPILLIMYMGIKAYD